MAKYRQVFIQWHDEPDYRHLVIVCIDENINDVEDDLDIFYYFNNESEYELAKQAGYNGYEFRIFEELG
jgi:hypothetical protein